MKKYRNLLFFIDGTELSADAKRANEDYSNVYSLNLLFGSRDSAGMPQIMFYYPGIGSTLNMPYFYSKLFARGLKENALQLYVNICSNYEPGDKIYIFGFSRGAIIARILSSLIGKIGIIFPEHIDALKSGWNLYENNSLDSVIDNRFEGHRFPNSKKDIIQFLGLFDAVSGPHDIVGLKVNDNKLPASVSFGAHILAMDEHRYLFSPSVFEEKTRKIEQIWIPGVHSDIGGVYKENYFGQISLMTMIDRISKYTNLTFYNNYIDVKITDMIRKIEKESFPIINNERNTFKFKILRPIDNLKNSTRTKYISSNNSKIHPIANIIAGREIFFKTEKEKSTYRVSEKLNISKMICDDLSENLWKRALSGRGCDMSSYKFATHAIKTCKSWAISATTDR
jgi:Uncharacterized alpha/beta hydrolase domain (DUF2235)